MQNYCIFALFLCCAFASPLDSPHRNNLDVTCHTENATLFYVDHGNEFSKLTLGNGSLTPINHGSTHIGQVRYLSIYFLHSRLFWLIFSEESRPHRYSYLRGSLEKVKVTHVDFHDSAKETVNCRYCVHAYLITQDNQIKVCCNRKMVLVRAPSGTNYRNLVLHPRRGQMFWIEESQTKCAIKIAGMDGRNVRDVQTFDRIHSFAFDVKNEMFYVATPGGIYLLSVNNPSPDLYLNVVASQIDFCDCTLYYLESQTGFINSYSFQNGIKKLAHVEDSTALFRVSSPCDDMPCAEYCLFAEGPEKAAARCVCPDCTEDTEENVEMLDFVEEEDPNWLARVFFTLFVLMAVAFCTEIKFNWASKLIVQLGQRFKLPNIPGVLFKNPNFNES